MVRCRCVPDGRARVAVRRSGPSSAGAPPGRAGAAGRVAYARRRSHRAARRSQPPRARARHGGLRDGGSEVGAGPARGDGAGNHRERGPPPGRRRSISRSGRGSYTCPAEGLETGASVYRLRQRARRRSVPLGNTPTRRRAPGPYTVCAYLAADEGDRRRSGPKAASMSPRRRRPCCSRSSGTPAQGCSAHRRRRRDNRGGAQSVRGRPSRAHPHAPPTRVRTRPRFSRLGSNSGRCVQRPLLLHPARAWVSTWSVPT